MLVQASGHVHITITKLEYLAARDNHVVQLHTKINNLENLVHTLIQSQTGQTVANDGMDKNDLNGAKSTCLSQTKVPHKCKLLDWSGAEEIVAEGRLCSDDPKELVNNIPLGPNAVKVIVDIPSKPEAFLWRPAPNMFFIEQAKGQPIAWPTDKVIVPSNSQKSITVSSGKGAQPVKCRVFNWSGDSEIVAEGTWISNDPKMLVNGIPLGPKAMIIEIDIAVKPEEFLCRPTPDMMTIEDVVDEKIAWPAYNVVLDKVAESDENASRSSVNKGNTLAKKKYRLLDVSGSGQIIAEGRWFSNDPHEQVHFVPLGHNAVKVWVDLPKVARASLWGPNSQLQFIEDAVGSTVAWPADKVVMI